MSEAGNAFKQQLSLLAFHVENTEKIYSNLHDLAKLSF